MFVYAKIHVEIAVCSDHGPDLCEGGKREILEAKWSTRTAVGHRPCCISAFHLIGTSTIFGEGGGTAGRHFFCCVPGAVGTIGSAAAGAGGAGHGGVRNQGHKASGPGRGGSSGNSPNTGLRPVRSIRPRSCRW
jgi:hypothetical protein